jgi:hypothetical protein
MRAKCGRTTYQLNTLFKNPDQEDATEIKVTDPRHPLFGRCFPLISISSSPHHPGYAYVGYRDALVLRLPLASTTLAPSRPSFPTKLTYDAVKELLAVAEECEVLCPIIPPPSGSACPPTYNNGSRTTSCRSCRR